MPQTGLFRTNKWSLFCAVYFVFSTFLLFQILYLKTSGVVANLAGNEAPPSWRFDSQIMVSAFTSHIVHPDFFHCMIDTSARAKVMLACLKLAPWFITVAYSHSSQPKLQELFRNNCICCQRVRGNHSSVRSPAVDGRNREAIATSLNIYTPTPMINELS